MGATLEPSESSVEQVAEIAGVHGGVEVRARFYALRSSRGTRHEIALEASGHRAVVDVPRGGNPRSLAERAMSIFADSLAARL
jgi:hypothetical protein